MKKLILIAATVIMTAVFATAVQAEITPSAPTGSGTWRSPYNISTAENLYWLSEYCAENNTDGKYFTLTNDIAVNAKEINANTTANDAQVWKPIMDFAGKFDGKNHTISGLFVRGSEYAGLFGTVKNTASIYNLTIDNSFFEGTKYTGAVAAYSEAKYLYDCTNKAEIRSYAQDAYTGGIVGYYAEKGYFHSCNNYGDIYGTDYTGGIVGYMAPMGECASRFGNHGTVCGTKYVGGIAGYLDCTFSTTKLDHCFNLGNIYGTEYAGGIAGYSYNYTGTSSGGGSASMACFLFNNAEECFNYGKISAQNTYPIAGHREGGFGAEDCYYLVGTASPDSYTQTVILPNGGGTREDFIELGTPLTYEEFAEGKATYLMNEDGGYLWGQNVDNDKPHDLYPCSYYEDHALVYYSVLDKKYSNFENTYERAYRQNGDVNMDEAVDILDTSEILKKADDPAYMMPIEVKFAEDNYTPEEPCGDIDCDGAVTKADAALMLKIMVRS